MNKQEILNVLIENNELVYSHIVDLERMNNQDRYDLDTDMVLCVLESVITDLDCDEDIFEKAFAEYLVTPPLSRIFTYNKNKGKK